MSRLILSIKQKALDVFRFPFMKSIDSRVIVDQPPQLLRPRLQTDKKSVCLHLYEKTFLIFGDSFQVHGGCNLDK